MKMILLLRRKQLMIIENNIPEKFFTTLFDMLETHQSEYKEFDIKKLIEIINDEACIAIHKNADDTYHLFGKIGDHQIDYSNTLDDCVKKIFYAALITQNHLLNYYNSEESKTFLKLVKLAVLTITNNNINFYDDKKMILFIENITKEFLEKTTFFLNYDGGHGQIRLETTKDDQTSGYHMEIKRFNRHSICKRIINFEFSSKYVSNIRSELALFQEDEMHDLTFIPRFLIEVGECIIDFYNELLHYDDLVIDDEMIERSLMERILLPGYRCSFFDNHKYINSLIKNALKNIDSN